MSKESMGQEIGLSKKWILNIIDEMITIWFIEKDEQTKFLKTTEKWYKFFVLDGEKSSPLVQNEEMNGEKSSPPAVKKVPPTGEKSSPYNNIDNNIDNNKNNIVYFSDEKLNSSFLLFIENRKQMRKKMTDIAIDRNIKNIEARIPKFWIPKIIEFIETSIDNGRQGIFAKTNGIQKEKMTYEQDRNNFKF